MYLPYVLAKSTGDEKELQIFQVSSITRDNIVCFSNIRPEFLVCFCRELGTVSYVICAESDYPDKIVPMNIMPNLYRLCLTEGSLKDCNAQFDLHFLGGKQNATTY